MTDIEFVKHRFAGKIKEIVKTYGDLYRSDGPRVSYLESYLKGFLKGLLYGTGLKITSVRNKGEVIHYVMKESTNKSLATIDLDSCMILPIKEKNK